MVTESQSASDQAADREAKLDRVFSIAYENEQKYGSCPQCVLAAIQEVIPGVVDDAAIKAGHALAGGGGLSGQGTCGALVGAIMAVGCLVGRPREEFGKAPYGNSFRLARKLHERFVAEYGSPICADVQTKIMGRSFDLLDKDDFKAFIDAGGHGDKCPKVAALSARWAAEHILNELDRRK